MKCLLFLTLVAVASALPFNLTQFLNSEGINPMVIITSNCILNGDSCSSSGRPCCLNPVFVCQPSPTGQNTCSVTPGHRVHIPIIRQIVAAFGATTQNPIY